jgi:molecular chaperone HscB
MTVDFAQDHFALFGIERRYALDTDDLDRSYLALQAQVHPDKHAHLGDVERRLAMQWATRVNEANQTLRNPIRRARYLLELAGVDAQIETNTAMPHEFLLQQLEWREAVAEAREAGDGRELDRLHNRLKRDMAAQYAELASAIDVAHDYARGAGLLRQMMFQDKLLAEIDAAIELLEA